jgi:hypothetical protein
MARTPEWAKGVAVPAGHQLRRKEQYEYTTPEAVYDIEVFEGTDGTWYAVGVPREGDKLVVYGSPVVDSRSEAIGHVLAKIRQYASRP